MSNQHSAELYPGEPDLEFGPDKTGKVVLGLEDPGYQGTLLHDVVAGPDGTLYAVGVGRNSDRGFQEYVVYAVKKNGEPDLSFSNNGKLAGQFHKQEGVNIKSTIHRVFYIEAQGSTPAKLLVLGIVGFPMRNKTGWYPALARYTLDGQLDATFGELGTGTAIFAGLEGSQWDKGATQGVLGSEAEAAPIPGIVRAGANHLSGLRYNDRIYISFPALAFGHAIISFFDDGRVDWSFGTDGILKLYDLNAPKPGMPIGAEIKTIYLSEGKLLLAGQLYKEGIIPYAGFVRITLEGLVDTSFGQEGFQFGPGVQYELVRDVISAFGRDFLTAGMGRDPEFSNCSVYAIDQNGLPDPDFNSGAVLTVPPPPFPGNYQQLWDFGDRVLAQGVYLEMPMQYGRLLLARFLSDGNLDKSFGLPNSEGEGAGWQVYPLEYMSEIGRMAVVDDRIYVTGMIREGHQSGFACLACLKA